MYMRHRTGRWISLLQLLVLLHSAHSLASSVPLESKIANPGQGHPLQSMGYSVAIDGDTMVTGAPYSRSDYFIAPGVARVYTRNAHGVWALQQELLATPCMSNIFLGKSLAISGDTIVVGGDGEDVSTGAAYVFTRKNGTWSQQARLVASDREQFDSFGCSVAISGDLVVVGAPDCDGAVSHEGAAYVFKRAGGTWTQHSKLSPSETGARAGFGSSVSASGEKFVVTGSNRTVVYSPSPKGWKVEADISTGDRHSGGVSLSGDMLLIGVSQYAHFYKWNGAQWQEQFLEFSNNIRFGRPVSIHGDVAIVGAPASFQSQKDAGAVHVYRRAGGEWSKTGTVQANDAVSGDSFGESVALTDGALVVGAPDDPTAERDSGAAYLFDYLDNSWQQSVKFTALNAAACDYFGGSVAINGNTAFIGVPGDNDLGLRSGAIFIYKYNGTTFTEHNRIKLSDGRTDEYFGTSVDVSGDSIIASAPGRKFGVGAAYVFQENGTDWTLQGELTDPNLTDHDNFASRVAISGDTAVVSASGDNLYTGAVYIFTRQSGVWSLQTKLTPSNGFRGLNFGHSLALDGDRLVVGATGGYGGYVYVYTRQTASKGADAMQGTSSIEWNETQLSPTGIVRDDCFGKSVAIWGNTILVGAYYTDIPTINSGSAYIFTRSGSTYLQTAILRPAVPSKQFGLSVALNRDSAIIGANFDSEKGNSAGAAFIFKRLGNSWVEQAKVTASDAAAHDLFGLKVDIDEFRAIVGASDKNDPEIHSGAAYIYQLPTAVRNWMKY